MPTFLPVAADMAPAVRPRSRSTRRSVGWSVPVVGPARFHPGPYSWSQVRHMTRRSLRARRHQAITTADTAPLSHLLAAGHRGLVQPDGENLFASLFDAYPRAWACLTALADAIGSGADATHRARRHRPHRQRIRGRHPCGTTAHRRRQGNRRDRGGPHGTGRRHQSRRRGRRGQGNSRARLAEVRELHAARETSRQEKNTVLTLQRALDHEHHTAVDAPLARLRSRLGGWANAAVHAVAQLPDTSRSRVPGPADPEHRR